VWYDQVMKSSTFYMLCTAFCTFSGVGLYALRPWNLLAIELSSSNVAGSVPPASFIIYDGPTFGVDDIGLVISCTSINSVEYILLVCLGGLGWFRSKHIVGAIK